MSDRVIGIDLGGTKVEACLLDHKHRCLARRRLPSEAARGWDHVLNTISSLVESVAGGRTYGAVGIGTPGTYVKSEDRLYGSPHTPAYTSPGFLRSLEKRLPVPVVIDNDANCLALAEFFSGCENKFRSVMAVILGTGVGSGLILNGRLYRGVRGAGGEIGHSSVDFQGRMCQCGRRGCLEAYLSGPSLSRRYAELSGESIPLEAIYRLYEDGHPLALDFFETSANILGEALANAVNVLDLEAIILGGGVSNLPLWYDKVPVYLKKSLFGVPREDLPLIQAKLGDSAGVFGAAFLALRELGWMDF